MLGITHTFCVLFGIFTILFSYFLAEKIIERFDEMLKSRKGQGRKKYIVKKKMKK